MSTVAVVGAGIVGASVAYHLARRGAEVTLFDRAPTTAAGATGSSFGWIGGTAGEWPGGAEDLRGSILADYRRLEGEVADVAVRWTGSVLWRDHAGQRRPDAPLAPGQQWIGPCEIAALEPHLHALPERAVYTPSDGGVDPGRLTRALVDAARAHGAQVVLSAGAVTLPRVGGRVTGVQCSVGVYPASRVVLAAGVDVARLCAPLGVLLPVAPSPALLLRASSPPGLVRTIVAGPTYEGRESHDGHLLMTAPYDERVADAALTRHVQQTLDRVQASFGAAGRLHLQEHSVGVRPMPEGGPIIGYVTPERSVYVAVMQSAVSLAPTAGRLVADELISDRVADELARCRPERFSLH